MLFACVTSGCCGLPAALCCLLGCVLLRAVTAVILALRSLTLTYVLRRLGADLSAQQDSYGATVEVVEHTSEDIERLEFVDQERVFLLVAGVLYAALEVVQGAQVLLPFIINHVEQGALLKLADYLLAVGLGSTLQVAAYVIYVAAVSDRYKNVLVHLSFGLIYLLDYGVGYLSQAIHLTLEHVECSLRQFLGEHCLLLAAERIFVERCFHSKYLQNVFLESFVIEHRAEVGYNGLSGVVDHVRYIHTDTLTHQGVAALGVDHVSLLVHHVIVLDQALTDTEVVLLNFLLRVLDRLADHRVLNHFALLHTQSVHHSGYTLRAEHTHQVVLQTDKEYRATRVSLTSGTTA